MAEMLDTIDKIPKADKLTETIASKLRALIREGALKPGDRLPSEKELCDAFGVGRSSVREALQALEHMGLVDSRQGVGRFLSADANSLAETLDWRRVLEKAPIYDLMEARFLLEVGVARLVATRASDEHLAHLARLLEQVKKGAYEDPDLFFKAEIEFHEVISDAAGNRVLAEMVRLVLHRVFAEAERFMRTVPYTCRDTAEMFERLLAAFQEGNSEKAAQIMQEHLEKVRSILNANA